MVSSRQTIDGKDSIHRRFSETISPTSLCDTFDTERTTSGVQDATLVVGANAEIKSSTYDCSKRCQRGPLPVLRTTFVIEANVDVKYAVKVLSTAIASARPPHR